MMAAVITPAAAAHRASEAPPLALDALYGTCATLIIAVLVVFYFDERVRRRLTAGVRGYAMGSLGGVMGTGLLIPLLALGGFISDTARVREITFGYTFVFLVAAFGAAIGVWGAEDGARRRATRPAQPPLPAVPAPRAGMTGRDHAAEVRGAALAVVSQPHPDVVKAHLSPPGAVPHAERPP